MKFHPLSFIRKRPWLSFVIFLEIAIIGVLAYSLQRLHRGIEEAYQRSETSVEMILASYTLRQSSDYLTRFARHYAVTGDPAYRDIYQQVLDIRRGEALRPKDYESIYWDLTEPYRSNAHPLLYPESLESILSGLPFTEEELALLQTAGRESEGLAAVELEAFAAVEAGNPQAAIDALFSVDYLRSKHEIMRPIDQFMRDIRQRIQDERETSLADAERQMQWVLWGAVLMLLGNAILYLRLPRAGP